MALPSSTTEPVSEPHPQDNPSDAQAEEADTQPVAENETEDTSQTSEPAETSPEESQDESDNEEDAEIKEWAAKKNLPLDDPLKIAKMYRESEKALGKKGQEEGQLKKAVDTANTESGVDGNQALENRVAALEFYIQHPDAQKFEGEMVKILEEKPWLAGDLETVLDAAKGRTSTEAQRLATERKAGKAEALAQAEKAQRAAPPKASATSTDYESGRITPENVNTLIGQHMGDRKWYNEHRAEIDAALAG